MECPDANTTVERMTADHDHLPGSTSFMDRSSSAMWKGYFSLFLRDWSHCKASRNTKPRIISSSNTGTSNPALSMRSKKALKDQGCVESPGLTKGASRAIQIIRPISPAPAPKSIEARGEEGPLSGQYQRHVQHRMSGTAMSRSI